MSQKNEGFQWRAFASVLVGFTFVVMTLSGIVLFFTPSGRIARDTGWEYWGFDRYDWITFHTWFSVLFVVM